MQFIVIKDLYLSIISSISSVEESSITDTIILLLLVYATTEPNALSRVSLLLYVGIIKLIIVITFLSSFSFYIYIISNI